MSRKFKKLCSKAVALLLLLVLLPMQVSAAASGTHTPVEGVTVGVTGASDNSMSNGVVTVTAKGSGGIMGFGASSKTATITITNETDKAAKISFDWTATSVNQLTIDGAGDSNTSGSFSKQMDSKASITITVTTAKNGTTNKLEMKNFSIVKQADSANVTVQFNSGYSVSVDGVEKSNGDVVNATTAGVTLNANTSNFVAWINAANHEVLSKSAKYVLKPTEDMTVKAINSTNACFEVGNKIFETLTEAATEANNGTTKTIVLLNNGTLPKGDYNIPSGVTLLIPNSTANAVYTTAPATTEATTLTTPTAFRTLTMANGANITVNGAISIGGTQFTSMAAGTPFGPVGFIRMNDNSNITIKNGANLYAWGYITGSGSVTVKSGGKVYECFQLADWRGGSATNAMLKNSEKIFPMSQYYVQNVEVPMTVEAGAKEYGHLAVDVSIVGIKTTLVSFIGDDGMFKINSGSFTKDYDEERDRIVVSLDNSSISISPYTIEVDAGLLGASIKINSSQYVLPVTSHLTLNVNSGSTVTLGQDIAFLPGCEVNIAEGASCVVANNSNIYVYDQDQWGTYCGDENAKFVAIGYAPGQKKTRTEADLVDAAIKVNGTLDASNGYIYATDSGANIYSTGSGTVIQRAGTNTVTYQATYKKDGYDAHQIAVAPAWLKHANGEYLNTETGTYVYNAEHAKWALTAHTFTDVVTEPTCTEGGFTTHTCICGYSYKDSETEPCHGWDREGGEFTTETTATCTEAGITTYTCSCGETKEEETEALDHDIVIDNAVEATCTATGLTEGQHCSRCDGATVAQQTVPMAKHTSGVAATCTAPQTCTVCGAELAPATGHAWDNDCDPDCNNNCGETRVITHSYTEKITTPATCEAEGVKTFTCGTCGDSYTEAIEKLGHNMVAGTVVAPTCTADGYTVYTCANNCGKTENRETVTAAGHNYTAVETAPTFEADGYTTYTCHCGDSYVETHEGTKLTAVAKIGEEKYQTLNAAIAAAQSGQTITLLADAEQNVVLSENVTLDLNGHSLKGKFVGKLFVNSGTYITPEGYTMLGENAVYYKTTDAVLTMGEYLAGQNYGDITVHSGILEQVPEVWWTGAGQTLTIEKGATFVIAKGKKLNVNGSNIVLNGKATLNGEINLYSADATVQAEEGLENIITTAGDKVWYTNGKYTVHSHTEAIDEAVAPTCTATGKTEGKHCSVCNEVLAAQETVDALGHTDTDNDGNHTCDREGCTEIVTNCADSGKDHVCDTDSVCSAYSTGDNVHADNNKDHKCDYGCNETIGECSDSDTDNDHICDYGCGKVYSECSDVTTDTDHNCDVCGGSCGDHIYDEQLPTDAYKATDATCIAKATYYKSCDCGEKGTDTFEHGDVNSNNHVNKTEHAEQEATCTEVGYTAGTFCEDCQTWISGHEEIQTTAHNYSNWTVTTPATCMDQGVETGTCVCGATSTRETAVNPDAHDLKTVAAQGATCTQIGWDEYQECQRAGCNYSTYHEKPVLEHEYTQASNEVVTPANCMTEAVYKAKCICGAVSDTKTITGEKDPSKHTGNNHTENAKDATCAEAGYTGDTVCECGVTVKKGTEIPATGNHSYGEGVVTQAPTCTVAGIKTFTCSVCNATKTETVEVLAHSYTEQKFDASGHWKECTCGAKDAVTSHSYTESVTKTATCTEAGEKTFTCTCGYSYSEAIDALSHNLVDVAGKEATCTEDGYTAYKDCSRCDYIEGKETIPAAHKLTKVAAKAPTCGEKGWEAYEKCSACDYTTYQEIPATGNHTYDNACDAECNVCKTTRTPADHVYDNTCDTNCNVCGDVRSTTHAWNDATCTEPKTCSVCGKTEGEAKGHSYGTPVWNWTGNDTDGYTVDKATFSCGACDHAETAQATVTTQKTDATTEAEGKIVYTATVTFKGKDYTDTKTVVIPKVEITGYQVTIDDRNVIKKGTATTTLDETVRYKAGDTFTVTSAKACVVAISTDGGESYEELSCVAAGENIYQFTIPEKINGDFQIGIVLRGDAIGDGTVNITDATRIARYSTRGLVGNNTLDSLTKFAGDAIGDGTVNITDATRVARYSTRGLSGNNTLEWKFVAN